MSVTLFEASRQRVGLRKTSQALSFMVQWGMVRNDLQREPTIEEYAEWWHLSERTAWREKALFVAAFPGEKSPSRLLDVASSQWDAKRGVAGLGATLLPA